MGVVADVVFETYEEMKDAAIQTSDSEYDRQRSRVQIVNTSFDASKVYINVSNTGETTLDTVHIDVLLNGTIATESVVLKEVSGTSTEVWGVHEVLYLEVGYSSANNWTRIRLITANGVSGTKVMK
jgi:archaellum component FlaF (FlaF/FlaG flagellin family)